MTDGRIMRAIRTGLGFAMVLAVAISLADNTRSAILVCAVGAVIAGIVTYVSESAKPASTPSDIGKQGS